VSTKIIDFSITKKSMLIILGKGNSESDYYGNYEKETLKWITMTKKINKIYFLAM